MIKVIEYVKDALPVVGKYVLLDGYMGRLAIKKGLNPDKYALTYDFLICEGKKIHVPTFPNNSGCGVYPLLMSGIDLTDQEPDVEDIYTIERLKNYNNGYTFRIEDDEEEEEYCCDWKGACAKEEKEPEPSEGDKLMDFFFNEKKKVVKEEEERKVWGKDGFEFF